MGPNGQFVIVYTTEQFLFVLEADGLGGFTATQIKGGFVKDLSKLGLSRFVEYYDDTYISGIAAVDWKKCVGFCSNVAHCYCVISRHAYVMGIMSAFQQLPIMDFGDRVMGTSDSVGMAVASPPAVVVEDPISPDTIDTYVVFDYRSGVSSRAQYYPLLPVCVPLCTFIVLILKQNVVTASWMLVKNVTTT